MLIDEGISYRDFQLLCINIWSDNNNLLNLMVTRRRGSSASSVSILILPSSVSTSISSLSLSSFNSFSFSSPSSSCSLSPSPSPSPFSDVLSSLFSPLSTPSCSLFALGLSISWISISIVEAEAVALTTS
jgi:hypothetical protein